MEPQRKRPSHPGFKVSWAADSREGPLHAHPTPAHSARLGQRRVPCLPKAQSRPDKKVHRQGLEQR